MWNLTERHSLRVVNVAQPRTQLLLQLSLCVRRVSVELVVVIEVNKIPAQCPSQAVARKVFEVVDLSNHGHDVFLSIGDIQRAAPDFLLGGRGLESNDLRKRGLSEAVCFGHRALLKTIGVERLGLVGFVNDRTQYDFDRMPDRLVGLRSADPRPQEIDGRKVVVVPEIPRLKNRDCRRRLRSGRGINRDRPLP